MARFLAFVKADAPLVLYVTQAAVTLLVSLSGSPGWTGAVATVTAGAAAILTTLATRPARVSAITGAAATILTAAGAFGLHLSSAQAGAAMPVLSVVLALLLRMHVSPASGQPSAAGVPAAGRTP